MQKRLIEEMAKLRGGKTRLKDLREEYHDAWVTYSGQAEEAAQMLDLIDAVTGESEAAATEAAAEDKDGSQEATEREPVDSIGE